LSLENNRVGTVASQPLTRWILIPIFITWGLAGSLGRQKTKGQGGGRERRGGEARGDIRKEAPT